MAVKVVNSGSDTINVSVATTPVVSVSALTVSPVKVTGVVGGAGTNYSLFMYGKANESISKGDLVMFGGAQGSHILFLKT